MSRIRCFLVVLLSATLPCPGGAPHAQALFDGVDAGMSMEQLLASVPGAVVPEPPPSLHPGDLERVRIEGLQLGGHGFIGHAYYRGDALSQLTLSLAHRDLPPDEALAAYDAVLAELVARHGPPSRSEDFLDDPQAPEREARWQVPGLGITLLYIGNSDGRGGYLSLLNVVFKPLAEETGRQARPSACGGCVRMGPVYAGACR
ncbi:exported hypothetical protein [uncultured Stenotrophomonas sp.]|uniref:Secreted protein n=1 Tax=uncultured Stenotrophomonas sp. TaxID=165438 RepID=A0A1Y5Q4C2_9GAMM|nr:exported hypothetical protein [uncultured Stenotrophomonas sp.]